MSTLGNSHPLALDLWIDRIDRLQNRISKNNPIFNRVVLHLVNHLSYWHDVIIP